MSEDYDPKTDPRLRPGYKHRAVRFWARGPLLREQWILAQNADQIVSACWPAHEWDAPPGQRRAARDVIASSMARQVQDGEIRAWEAGQPGHDRWTMREQPYAIEQALLAARDDAVVDPGMPWPEHGPRLVLARHLHAVADERRDAIHWIDSRTPNALLRSLRDVGLVEFGPI